MRVSDHAALSGPVGLDDAGDLGGSRDSRGALVNRLSRAVGTPAAEAWTGLEAVGEPLRRVLDQMGSPAPDLRTGGWVGGAGAAWYVAAGLDTVSRAALLRLVCAHARVRPVVADLPDGVEAQRRGEVLFLLNHGDRAAEVAGVVGTDLLTGEACTGHVVLAPRSALVVRENTQRALA